jgi:hypothetical protein
MATILRALLCRPDASSPFRVIESTIERKGSTVPNLTAMPLVRD